MKIKKILTSMTRAILLSIGLLISLGVGLAIGYVGGLVKDQPVLTQKEMKEQINNISKNSEVYFGSGEKLGTVNSELIRKLLLTRISVIMLKMLLSQVKTLISILTVELIFGLF